MKAACTKFARELKSEATLLHFFCQKKVISTIHLFGRAMNFFECSSGRKIWVPVRVLLLREWHFNGVGLKFFRQLPHQKPANCQTKNRPTTTSNLGNHLAQNEVVVRYYW